MQSLKAKERDGIVRAQSEKSDLADLNSNDGTAFRFLLPLCMASGPNSKVT